MHTQRKEKEKEMLPLIIMPMHSKMNYFNVKANPGGGTDMHDEVTVSKINISKMFTTNEISSTWKEKVKKTAR